MIVCFSFCWRKQVLAFNEKVIFLLYLPDNPYSRIFNIDILTHNAFMSLALYLLSGQRLLPFTSASVTFLSLCF